MTAPLFDVVVIPRAMAWRHAQCRATGLTALRKIAIPRRDCDGKRAGADSVILGCTEIGLVIGERDIDLPAFDSTPLHADAALARALA